MKSKEISSKKFPASFFEDEKIKFIGSEFGDEGVVILLSLYCKILNKSYYYEWNNKVCRTFTSTYLKNISFKKVEKVVDRALELDIFNIDRYKSFGVLTSFYFQQAFFSQHKSDKDVNVSHPEFLIGENEVKKVQLEKKDKRITKKEKKTPLFIDDYATLERLFKPTADSTEEDITSLPDDIYISREVLGELLEARGIHIDDDINEEDLFKDQSKRIAKEPIIEDFTLKSGQQKAVITRKCQAGDTGKFWQEYLILTYDLTDELLN